MKFGFFLLLTSIIFSPVTGQQTSTSDTLFLTRAVANATLLYEKTLDNQSILYNGTQYIEPDQVDDHHPFFFSDDWIMSSVEYDGQQFENVPLLYDLTNDKVVSESHNGSLIELIRDKLISFTIADHRFIKIVANNKNRLPRTGFYDVLYNGTHQVIVLRTKSDGERVTEQRIVKDFEEKNRYFLLKNGEYFSVGGRAAILGVLADQKQALKKHIKRQSLDFNANREYALAALASYYDTLNKEKQ
jgi:hypothetical protein